MRSKIDQSSIAIVVVNWNTPSLVLDCLASLRESLAAKWHLFLVDNNSTDNSAELLSDLGSDVTFIQSPTNGGWTGGNNIGVLAAMQAGYNVYFILNSDALVLPDTLAHLANCAQKRPSAVIGPIQTSLDGTHYNFAGTTVNNDTGLPIAAQTFSIEDPAAKSIGDFHPSAYVQGSGIFLNRKHFDLLGLFDDRYYLNFDDTAFCAKARSMGLEVIIYKKAVIRHAFSATIGGTASPLNMYFLTRNSLLYAEDHSSPAQRRMHVFALLRIGLSSTGQVGILRRAATLLVGRELRLRAFRRGVIDYIMRRFGDCPISIRKMQSSAMSSRL